MRQRPFGKPPIFNICCLVFRVTVHLSATAEKSAFLVAFFSICVSLRGSVSPCASSHSFKWRLFAELDAADSDVRHSRLLLQLLIVGALFSNCASLQNPPELWRNALVCFASRYFLLDPFSHPAPERQLPGNWRSVHFQPSSAPVKLSSLIREAIRSKFPHSGNLVLFFWTSKSTDDDNG